MKCLVTFANAWSLVDDRTGEKKEGITVEYLMTDTFAPVVNDDGSRGVRHCKESLSLDKLPNIKEIPGWYDLDFALKPGSKGKPVMKLDNMKFLQSVYSVVKSA